MSIKSKTVLVTLVVCVVTWSMSGCGFIDEPISVCDESQGQIRNGLLYLPNQEVPFTGRNLCKYRNGQRLSEGSYKGGEKDGKWSWWYENGQISQEGSFKDGMYDGEWTRWYQNGQKRAIYNSARGLKEGEGYEWYENGQIQKKGKYKGGKETGEWTDWYENGQTQIITNFKDGVLHGNTKTWFENGNRRSEGHFKDGLKDGTWFEWYDPEVLDSELPRVTGTLIIYELGVIDFEQNIAEYE